jgi:cardiolipin synthase
VLTYRPEAGRFAFRRHRLRRLHRKLAVVDGRLAFAGGINVVDDFDHGEATRRAFDFAVRIEGPLARACTDDAPCLAPGALGAPRPPPAAGPLPACRRRPVGGAMQAALLVRDNLRHRHDIEYAYLRPSAARSEILIANAYFLPGRRFRKFAAGGGRARRAGDRCCCRGAPTISCCSTMRRCRFTTACCRRGARLRVRPAELHAKVAVVDDDWATVGSSNIDPFSLLLAREANIVVRDPGFAGELRASLAAAIARSAREIRPEDQQGFRGSTGLSAPRLTRWCVSCSASRATPASSTPTSNGRLDSGIRRSMRHDTSASSSRCCAIPRRRR